MRYKKKKAQLHDTTQLARANHGRRMQRGGGPLARERLFDTSQEMPMKTCSPCHYEILFTSNFLLIFWVFDWPAVTTQCSTKETERERVRERDRARENQLAHAGARDLPQSEPSQTQRERDNIPPTQKRSESFCRSLTGVAQAQGLGQGAGQGASRGRPCRDRRTEMGRAQQRTDMQLQLLLWRPGWEL